MTTPLISDNELNTNFVLILLKDFVKRNPDFVVRSFEQLNSDEAFENRNYQSLSATLKSRVVIKQESMYLLFDLETVGVCKI